LRHLFFCAACTGGVTVKPLVKAVLNIRVDKVTSDWITGGKFEGRL
jgi:hypothetical protein